MAENVVQLFRRGHLAQCCTCHYCSDQGFSLQDSTSDRGIVETCMVSCITIGHCQVMADRSMGTDTRGAVVAVGRKNIR